MDCKAPWRIKLMLVTMAHEWNEHASYTGETLTFEPFHNWSKLDRYLLPECNDNIAEVFAALEKILQLSDQCAGEITETLEAVL